MLPLRRKPFPPIIDYDILPLEKWFADYIGTNFSDLETHHPLRKYYDDYLEWAKEKFQKHPSSRVSLPESIMEFANFLKGVQICRALIDPVKNEFIADVMEPNSCYGVFFEIRVLTHFYNFQFNRFIENLAYRNAKVNDKKPDIMFTKSGSLKRIFLECTRKYEREMRCKSDTLLIEDLMRSLKDKAEIYQNIDSPIIYAVHVPEIIQFDRNEFRQKLGLKLLETLKDRIYRNVNYVTFSSYKSPILVGSDVMGNIHYDTDIPNLRYPNAWVEPSLKENLDHFLFIS